MSSLLGVVCRRGGEEAEQKSPVIVVARLAAGGDSPGHRRAAGGDSPGQRFMVEVEMVLRPWVEVD